MEGRNGVSAIGLIFGFAPEDPKGYGRAHAVAWLDFAISDGFHDAAFLV